MILQENIQKHHHSKHSKESVFVLNDLISHLTNTHFLTQIHGIGEKMIQALQAFFHDENNITILQNLIDA
jgi:NAD-dependent DNA ligase